MFSLYPVSQRIIRRISEIPQRGLPMLRLTPTTFDREYGVETTKLVWLTNPFAKNFAHGVRYEACNPEACKWAIGAAAIDTREFFFVDMGCGKGRPLIIASRYEFSQLIGVDYSRRLCRRASRNLKICAVDESRFRIVNLDAAEFEFPDHNLFVYFFNPFDREILTRVLQNLEAVACRFRVIVAFEYPNREILESCHWLRKHSEGPNILLLTSDPAIAA